MKLEEELDLLKKVAKVDASPFLMTQIAAKIRARQAEYLPGWWTWAGSLAFSSLLILNVFLAKNDANINPNPSESLAESLKIQTSNQFYHE